MKTGIVGFAVCAMWGRLSGHSSSRYSAARGSPSNVKIKRSFSLNHSKRLITVGCDGSRYNMMGVDLMKTVAHPTSESVEPIVNILANPILGIAIALLDFTLEVFAPPIDAY